MPILISSREMAEQILAGVDPESSQRKQPRTRYPLQFGKWLRDFDHVLEVAVRSA